MKNITEVYNKLSNLQEDDENNTNQEVMLFMNTWGNYNINGADIDNINGGWKTPDEALNWYNEMNDKGEEPFINDIDDNVGLPFEVTEYSNVPEVVEEINKYLELDEYDRKVIGALMENDSSLSFDEANSIFKGGDYVFYEDVNNDYDLGYAEVESCGNIIDAVGEDRIENYINEDDIFESWEADLRDEFASDNDIDIDDIDDDEFEEYAYSVIRENIVTAIADNNMDFLSDWFDYEAYGRDLSFDFNYTSYGAIYVY